MGESWIRKHCFSKLQYIHVILQLYKSIDSQEQLEYVISYNSTNRGYTIESNEENICWVEVTCL